MATRAAIRGISSIQLVPISGSPILMRALADPIQLGPLPEGIRLTSIVLHKGGATIAGSGDAGELKA